MCSATAHVCFAPESDIKCDVWGCPLWANSGHELQHPNRTRTSTNLKSVAAVLVRRLRRLRLPLTQTGHLVSGIPIYFGS